MDYSANKQDFGTAAVRSSLSEFASENLKVIRPCQFSYPAKILTPVDDILVPLVAADAVESLLARSGVSGVIATPEMADLVPDTVGLAIANDPMLALNSIHLALARMPGRLWNDFPSEIDPSAEVSPVAWVAAQNVRIGPNVVLMPGAIVHERTVIGAGTRVHSQAVIGSDAYEIIVIEGRQSLRPQTGGVIVGERCEIMAGVVITKSAFCGATFIGSHSVLDSNVVVSHDCRIGEDVRVGGSSWLGGRVTVGGFASLGPNCTIGNGVSVGLEAKVSLGSVVTRDVKDREHVSGNFAIEHKKMIDQMRRIR